MSRKLHLLIIDPQNDFCDLPPACLPPHAKAALPVPGAHADMQRLAHLITRAGDAISGISVTLDSHHVLDIAHPGFWQKRDEAQCPAAVTPFTTITAADVRAGRFQPRIANSTARVLSYLDTLEASGRYQLMVWPQHCVIGSWGHTIHADVQAALQDWQTGTLRHVNYVSKGEHPWTEHYSAIQAEVPDSNVPETGLNHALLALLAQQDQIVIAGEAGSHCVKATTEHIIAHIGSEHVKKLVLLTDCISPVSGFEAQYRAFLADCQAKGVRLATSDEIMAQTANKLG